MGIPPTSPGPEHTGHRARRDTPRPFSVQLQELALRLGDGRVRFDELSAVLQGKTLYVVIIVLCLPFLLPIPLPLLSTPFGILIALTGLRIALRQKPWMPQSIAHREIPAGFLPRLLTSAAKLTKLLERISKPRWVFPAHLRRFHQATGFLIALAGLLLLLPVPVPLSNLLPASAILLFATGSLRRDGLCFVVGCFMLTLSLGFFIAIGLLGVEAVNWIWK
jgi:hypothetical protein